MNGMENYKYANLTQEQEEILKKAEQVLNEKTGESVVVMAFDSKK